jgi:hypothetical protein
VAPRAGTIDDETIFMTRDWRAGDDAESLALELEHRALTHEKVLDHLDLRAARSLRELARRIRDVVDRDEDGDLAPHQAHVELLKLRLEAMSALLTELVSQPRAAPPKSGPAARADDARSTSAAAPRQDLAALVARRRAVGGR